MTVGYGDISGKNPTEVLVNVIIVVLGCIIFSYYISNMGIIL